MQTGSHSSLEFAQVLDALLAESGFNTHVCGDCMAPFINDRSMVTVDPESSMRSGDIMVWRSQAGQLVCHRYLGRFPSRKGVGAVSWADSSCQPDGLVPMSRVLGRVAKVDGEPFEINAMSRLKAWVRYLRYSAIRVARKLRA